MVTFDVQGHLQVPGQLHGVLKPIFFIAGRTATIILYKLSLGDDVWLEQHRCQQEILHTLSTQNGVTSTVIIVEVTWSKCIPIKIHSCHKPNLKDPSSRSISSQVVNLVVNLNRRRGKLSFEPRVTSYVLRVWGRQWRHRERVHTYIKPRQCVCTLALP